MFERGLERDVERGFQEREREGRVREGEERREIATIPAPLFVTSHV